MNILITGGTGFIGSRLCKKLIVNHTLYVLTRNPERARKKLSNEIFFVKSLRDIDPSTPINTIINLAGEAIADKRWSADRKKRLETSRVDLTADLISFIEKRENKPTLLISGSAIGYYGDCGSNTVTEQSDPNDEYTHRLCADWENQALRAKASDVRVCILRTGIVIGSNGGLLKKLLPTFQIGLGARLADGNQWMSWIHIDDYINMILFLMDNETQSGIFNATAPQPVTNAEFTKTFANVLNRPSFLVLPRVLLEKIFGEMSCLLSTGQRVIPKKFQDTSFYFEYSTLKPALTEACNKN